ncbi:MAG: hypothetical protein WBK91_10690 [Alphaproteobacteria bacterium]
MPSKEVLGIISVLIVAATFVAYFRDMFQGRVKPHSFSWIIWGLTTGIAAAARTVDEAGAGVWGQWVTAASCILCGLMAFKYGEKNITRSDLAAFVMALTAIPAWLATDNPLTAVIIVTIIDAIGYYPTIRKTYWHPYEEALYNYLTANIIHLLSLAATEHYTLTNTLFQIVFLIVNSLMVGMILWRRRCLSPASIPERPIR